MIRPVDIALRYEGVRESGGPNRGPDIDRWLRMVGKNPERGAFAWCAAFVCGCTLEAYQNNWMVAGNAGPFDPAKLPIPMTAGVFMLWNSTTRKLRQGPRPGAVFIIDHGVDRSTGFRRGHTGFVLSVEGDSFRTVEGNTSVTGSREGDGVYVRTRKVKDMLGFLDVNPEATQGEVIGKV